ncbi:MAG: YraN family protein [Alphaproteobacteria bacterium]|nr:YraN family protein [Alphaproteobacteria bacterium]
MRSRTTYNTGLISEFYARMYLRLHGFRIVSSRYITGRHTHRAELDIIARRGNLLVFIEVKNRPTISAATAAVSGVQAMRLRRAAETYMMRTGWVGDSRFDIIAVCGFRIYWIKNAI